MLPLKNSLDDFIKYPDKVLYPFSTYNKWIGGILTSVQQYIFFMILPALAALPYGSSYFSDVKTGYIKNLFTRTEKKYYFYSKYIVNFVTGGMTVTIPLIVNFLLTSATLPSLIPQPYTHEFALTSASMWAKLFFTKPFLYIIAYLALIFVFSGLLAEIPLLFSSVVNSKFVVIFSPFVLTLFVFALCQTFDIEKFSSTNFLNPAQPALNCNFIIIALEAAIIEFATICLFIIKGKKSDAI